MANQLTAAIDFHGPEYAHIDLRVIRLERVTETDAKGNISRTIVRLEGVIYDPQEQPPPPSYGRQLDLEDLKQ